MELQGHITEYMKSVLSAEESVEPLQPITAAVKTKKKPV